MTRHHVPIGSDAELTAAMDAEDTAKDAVSAWVTVGTAAPGAAYVTPIYYNSAGTASYVWGGTSYVKIQAVQ